LSRKIRQAGEVDGHINYQPRPEGNLFSIAGEIVFVLTMGGKKKKKLCGREKTEPSSPS
jgi:hypothetical protein